jgi:hypothetical protein
LHRYKGFLYINVHSVLFGATALLGLCVKLLLKTELVAPDPITCRAKEERFDASGTSLMCGSLMLFVVLVLQCLHRGVHTHRNMVEDMIFLECELFDLEQSKRHEDCAVDIQTFKRLLRSLDDPADVKRIFGKDWLLPPGVNASDKTPAAELAQAEAKEKQLIEVFNMFATDGSNKLGSKELRTLHTFLSDAAAIDKRVRARGAWPHARHPMLLLTPLPTQRTLFATQSRMSKILRLLLSVFLLVMALLRLQRVGIGARLLATAT